MSAAQMRNYAINAAAYLNAAKKGIIIEERTGGDYEYDHDIGNEYDIQDTTSRRRNTLSSSSSSSSSSSTKKSKSTIRRSDRIKQQKQKTQQQQQEQQQQQQQQQNDEMHQAATILASIADVAVTRSQVRNKNKVTWTDQDRFSAAQAAAIALEVAAEAANLAEGKKRKEKSTPYWTRYQEKRRSTNRFQKEMERVIHIDT